MSNYALGATFERRVKKQLEDAGYFVVRSAGSKGQLDLVAFGDGRTLFIQCKRARLTSGEWAALAALADRLGAIPILADRVGLWILNKPRVMTPFIIEMIP